MSLRDQFRLHFGEGSGKKTEEAFNLFRLGYEYGLEEAAKVCADSESFEGTQLADDIRQRIVK